MTVKYGNENPVEISGDQSILDELENKGLSPDSGCRSASCGVCACEVLEGAEALSSVDAVEEDTIGHLDKRNHPIRLICRAELKDMKSNVILKPYHQ